MQVNGTTSPWIVVGPRVRLIWCYPPSTLFMRESWSSLWHNVIVPEKSNRLASTFVIKRVEQVVLWLRTWPHNRESRIKDVMDMRTCTCLFIVSCIVHTRMMSMLCNSHFRGWCFMFWGDVLLLLLLLLFSFNVFSINRIFVLAL